MYLQVNAEKKRDISQILILESFWSVGMSRSVTTTNVDLLVVGGNSDALLVPNGDVFRR